MVSHIFAVYKLNNKVIMKKGILCLFVLFFFLSMAVDAQSINVSNITTVGRFNTCSAGAPVITATLVSGNGSIVVNGALTCINPADTSIVNITISNILWDKNPDNNWIHGVFFSANGGTTVTSNSLAPSAWIFMAAGCTGQCPSSGAIIGGSGFYYSGSGQSCCPGGASTSYPCDNYGDPSISCTTPFTLSYQLKIRNNFIVNNLTLRIRGTSDGATGCWTTQDLITNNITFTLSSLACFTNPLICNPVGSAIFRTNLSAPYQWQQSVDSIVFNNITDNANYVGANSANLSLSNIPSNRYGEQFRCIANGITGQVFTIKFSNTWTGAINSDWDTAGNWSCGTVPDDNTDVVINFGNVIISSNASIRSLTIKPPATLTTNTGVVLTILH
jgi:hypothetical protein